MPMVGMFMGLDGLLGGKPETKLIMRQKTTGIKIRQGSHVSDWERIEERFADSISSPGLVIEDWKEACPIMTRWAVKADPASSDSKKLCLVLEGMPCGNVDLEKLDQGAKKVVHGGTTRTFLLWSTEASWYAPSSKLCTNPGVFIEDKRDPPLTDPFIRLHVQWAMEMSRRRQYVTDARDWFEFLEAPVKVPSPTPLPMGFVFPTGKAIDKNNNRAAVNKNDAKGNEYIFIWFVVGLCLPVALVWTKYPPSLASQHILVCLFV